MKPNRHQLQGDDSPSRTKIRPCVKEEVADF
jgi:hypothetical protein